MAIKETIPFNFDEIYKYIEDKFVSAGYDVQEGSNSMQLVTSMSYLVSMLNANTAVNINETLLPLARKRENVLQDARVLGYELDHIRSYQYNLKLLFENHGTYLIEKYSRFTAGDKSYYYIPEEDDDRFVNVDQLGHKLTFKDVNLDIDEYVYLSDITNTYIGNDTNKKYYIAINSGQVVELIQSPNEPDEIIGDIDNNEVLNFGEEQYIPVERTIRVIEGTLYKYTDEETLKHIVDLDIDSTTGAPKAEYYYDIPFTDVEENGIEVFLTYYDDLGVLHEDEPWYKNEQFMIDSDTVLNHEFIRLDNIEYKTPRIYFKLGDVGKELRVGTILKINILKSSGENGQILEDLKSVDLDCKVLKYDLIIEGSKEESIESIKQNAPIFHNSANRLITKPDYIAYSNRQSLIKDTYVWDGDDEWPKVPGHIWFTYLPNNTIREFSHDDTRSEWNLSQTSNYVNWFLDQGPWIDDDGIYQRYDEDVLNIWDFMDNYKIPTLVYHHRNPIYFDFEYEIQIIKYNLAKSLGERNEEVFNVINDYFLGIKEDKPIESFNCEYFQSNLAKRIDIELSDLMGLNMSLKTFIPLLKNNINYDSYNEEHEEYDKELIIHLGVPYETIFNTDALRTVKKDNMPVISAKNITLTNGLDNCDLKVDFDNTNYEPDTNGEIIFYDIYASKNGNDFKVGKYRLYKGVQEDIEIILYIDRTANVGYSTIDSSSLDKSIENGDAYDSKLNVQYVSNNIRFVRNTIPRLKKVKFIQV